MDNKNLPKQFGCALNLYTGVLFIAAIIIVSYLEAIPAVSSQIKTIEASLSVKFDLIGIALRVLLFTILTVGLYRLKVVRVLLKKLSKRFGE